MNRQKHISYLGALGVTLSVELLGSGVIAPPLLSLTFPPTQNVGAPARTIGGGQRGTCFPESDNEGKITVPNIKGEIRLTPLTPSNNLVTTISANPSLFLYVPKTEAKSAEFKLAEIIEVKPGQNQESIRIQYQEVYRTFYALDGTPGVVKLNLPPTVSLEIGKKYHWSLRMVCNLDKLPDKSQDQIAEGWIQRTELTLGQKTQLAAAKEPLKQAEIYAQAKIWQESLNILAQLRAQRPNDSRVNQEWQELLNSVELDKELNSVELAKELVNAPIIGCCQANAVVNMP